MGFSQAQAAVVISRYPLALGCDLQAHFPRIQQLFQVRCLATRTGLTATTSSCAAIALTGDPTLPLPLRVDCSGSRPPSAQHWPPMGTPLQ